MRLAHAGSTLAHAGSQASGMIYNTVLRQATMLAFLDDFKMLGIVLFLVLPVLLLAKKPKVQGGSVPVH